MTPQQILLFILGPTASGKSDIAIEIAERCRPTSILNCDSIQFFDGVEIGAAKPTPKDLARVPHFLIGHRAKGSEYTAGDFRREALKTMAELSDRDFLAVGGSGFYVQALEKGMFEVPPVAPEIRETLEAEMVKAGPETLHLELRERDPETASRIQPRDRYRILRALELLRSGTETLTEMRARFERERLPAPFQASKIGLRVDRDRLRERVTLRTRKMLEAGLIEEVAQLRSEGLTNWAPLRSVGYKETQAFLDGEITRAELEPLIVTSTLQLAKRQMTWFRRDSEIRWLNPESERARLIDFAQAIFERVNVAT